MSTNDSLYLEMHNDEYARKHLVAISYIAIMMIVGLIGNSIVCYIYMTKFKPTTTRYFIVVVAVLDILNCLVSMPMRIFQLRYFITFGRFVICKLLIMIVTFFNMSSASVLLIVAVDRYRKICRPFQKQVEIFTVKVVCGIIFLLTIFSVIPVPFIYGSATADLGNVNGTMCSYTEMTRTYHLTLTGFYLLVFTCIGIAMVVLYTCIWTRVYQQRKYKERLVLTPAISRENIVESQATPVCSQEACRSNTNQTLESLDDGNKQDTNTETSTDSPPKTGAISHGNAKSDQALKMTISMFVITVVFFLSYVPYFTVVILERFNEEYVNSLTDTQYAVFATCWRSYFLQSAANPVIYSFVNASFRREVKKLCSKRTQ